MGTLHFIILYSTKSDNISYVTDNNIVIQRLLPCRSGWQ